MEEELRPDDRCVHCEGPATECLKVISVPYGSNGDTVDVTMPVISCAACDESWMDWRAEAVQHDAVCNAQGLFSPASLIALRKHLGIDQAQACASFGIPPKMIADWESRRRWPDPVYSAYMKRVAHAVGSQEIPHG